MKGRHIKWDESWIADNFSPSLTWAEVAKMYDDAHGTETKPRTLQNKCHQMGIVHHHTVPYTDAEKEFLIENWADHGSRWCSEHITAVSGNRRSFHSTNNIAQTLGLKASAELMAAYQEEKVSKKRRPVGYLKMDNGSKVPYIKTENGWETLASVVYGKPKKGNMLCYLDGDKNNCTLENIGELSRKESAYMTHNKFWSENSEITKSGIIWCKLKQAYDDAI